MHCHKGAATSFLEKNSFTQHDEICKHVVREMENSIILNAAPHTKHSFQTPSVKKL